MTERVHSGFATMLRTARLSRPKDAAAFRCLSIENPPAVDEKNRVIEEESFDLWLRDDTGPSVEGLLSVVQRRLAKHRHKDHRDLAIILLQMCCALSDGEGIDESVFDRVVESVVDGDANQYHVSSLRFPQEWSFSLPPFSLGKLDVAKIKYQSERAGSDFANRYVENLAGRYAVSRPAVPVRVIDGWTSFSLPWPFSRPTGHKSMLYALTDRYFHLLSAAYFDEFWSQFDDVQDILVAAGAPYLDQRGLRTYFTHQQFTIFLNCGPRRAGWVAPNGGMIKVDWSNVHVRIPKKISELRTEYAFDGLMDTESHNLLRQFAKFFARGKRHLMDGRKDEGFLHLIIALDLVLGDKQQSTAKITKRAAALVGYSSGNSYGDEEKKIRDLYGQRSRYVHEGRSVGEDKIVELEGVCDVVLKSLLRLQARKGNAARVAEWQKDLDYIVGAIEAGRPLEDHILADVGAVVPRVT
jgi:hypothetical protein